MPDWLTQFGETLNLQSISAASYNLTNEHHGKTLLFNSASPQTMTIRRGLHNGLTCRIIVTGAGGLTLAEGSGVTIHNNYVMNNTYLPIDLYHFRTNEYTLLTPTAAGVDTRVYLASYGHTQAGLDAAIAAIGSNQRTLVVTSQCPVTSDTTIPSNILVCIEGNGSFTVASSKTLTISSFDKCAPYQVFFGSGKCVFAKNATGGRFRIEWWAGISNSSDLSTIYVNCVGPSVLANTGGAVEFGAGVWKFKEITLDDYTTWEGVGSGTDGTSATIWKVADTFSTYIVRGYNAFRHLVFRNGTFSTQGTNTAANFLATGTAGNTAVGLTFDGVTFYGDQLTQDVMVNIYDPTLSGWQLEEINFNHCDWICPEGATCVRVNSPNTSLNFLQAIFSVGLSANCIDAQSVGFLNIVNSQAAGTGFSSVHTSTSLDRTITQASITIGTKDLTISTGAFSSNDLGRKVLITGKLDSYIDRVDSATAAHVHDNATATATNAAMDVYKWTDTAARGGYFVKLGGGHGVVNIVNCVDEGMNSFLINDVPDTAPINIIGCWPQTPIRLNYSGLINSTSNRLSSGIFRDAVGSASRIFSQGDYVSYTTTNIVTGNVPTTLLTKSLWAEHYGAGTINTEFGTDFTTVRQQLNMQTDVIMGPEFDSSPDVTNPVFGVYSHYDSSGLPTGPHKPLLRVGVTNPITNQPRYYYDLVRNAYDGYLEHRGNQTGFMGYRFDGNVNVTGTGVLGYATDPNGGTTGASVTQTVSKSTTVDINAPCGTILTHNATLNAGTEVQFTVNNSFITQYDTVIVNQRYTGNPVGVYLIQACPITAANQVTISIRNLTAGNLSENISILFSVIKSTIT